MTPELISRKLGRIQEYVEALRRSDDFQLFVRHIAAWVRQTSSNR